MTYKRIRIIFYICSLLVLTFPISATADYTQLSWDAPINNRDGSYLTDLKGYKLYYGTSSGRYNRVIDVGNVTSYFLSNLTEGATYYFALTAYNSSGLESDFSSELKKTINASSINIPPTQPQLTYPLINQNISEISVTFRWEGSSDYDCDLVEYDFTLCTDQEMTSDCITDFVLASRSGGIYYAGMGGSYEWLIYVSAISIILTGFRQLIVKARLLVSITVACCILLSSCGGGNGTNNYTESSCRTESGTNDSFSLTLSGLSPDSTYYWKVTARDSEGGETESTIHSFTTAQQFM